MSCSADSVANSAFSSPLLSAGGNFRAKLRCVDKSQLTPIHRGNIEATPCAMSTLGTKLTGSSKATNCIWNPKIAPEYGEALQQNGEACLCRVLKQRSL